MSTYAVGDIQGCLGPLRRTLEVVKFDPAVDRLWCTGDVINRGPESLETLRFLRELGASVTCVLGNHDLHFLAVAFGVRELGRRDTLKELLGARDCGELVEWLRQRPLFHRDDALGWAMVHAGVPPYWSVEEAERYAAEVSAALRGDGAKAYLAGMYGGEPARFAKNLYGPARLRAITNLLTRMRYLRADGSLELETKCHPSEAPPALCPWYAFPDRKRLSHRLVFGHWATLNGDVSPEYPDVVGLDTGCVWGRNLSLLRLEDGERFTCDCAV